jgi:hypothetical protein
LGLIEEIGEVKPFLFGTLFHVREAIIGKYVDIIGVDHEQLHASHG